VKEGYVFITVTGNKHVIANEHFSEIKNGAVLANSGYFDIVKDVDGSNGLARQVKRIRQLGMK
jgi:adenosylhomocysteinase